MQRVLPLLLLALLLPFLPISVSSPVHVSLARQHQQQRRHEALDAVNGSVSSLSPSPAFHLGPRGEREGDTGSSSSSPAVFLPASIAGPFLHPLLSVGSIVSPPHRAFLPRPQFELLEFLRPIPVPAASSSRQQPSVSSSAGLLPFASTSLSPFVASPSSPHPLLLPDHSLPLSQLERIAAASSAVSALLPPQRDDDRREAGLTSSASPADAADGSFSSSPFDYELQSKVGRGGYGELWKARRLRQSEAERETEAAADEAAASSGSELFVLKRLLVEKGEDVRLSGLREMHFGSLLQSASPHIARYVDAFELDGELWLVFRYEGVSLRAYTSAFDAGGRRVVSDEWRTLRMEMMTDNEKADWRLRQRTRQQTQDEDAGGCYDSGCDELNTVDLDKQREASGTQTASLPSPPLAASHALSLHRANLSFPAAAASVSSSSSSSFASSAARPPPGSLLRDLLSQLFSAVAAGHRLGVTHRDLKPDNVLLRLHRHHPHHSYRLQQPGTEHDFLSPEEEEEEEHAERADPNSAAQRDDEPQAASLRGSSSALHSSLPAPVAAARFFRQPSSWSSLGHVRLCDYGSAIDAVEETNSRLYPQRGPSPLESSLDYAPPELLFFSSTQQEQQQQQQQQQQSSPSSPPPSLSSFFQPSYDSWSLGVVMLELLLGSRSRVFALDARVKAVMQQRIGRSVSEQLKEKAVLFRALMDYCVYEAATPAATADGGDGGGDGDGDALPAAAAVGRCNHTRVAEMLRRYDPMRLGLGDLSALMPDGEEQRQQQRAAEAADATWWAGSSDSQQPPLSLLFYLLLRRLLQWNPQRRLAVEDALQHAYFHGHLFHCQLCSLSFELPGLLHAHILQQHRQQQYTASRQRHLLQTE